MESFHVHGICLYVCCCKEDNNKLLEDINMYKLHTSLQECAKFNSMPNIFNVQVILEVFEDVNLKVIIYKCV